MHREVTRILRNRTLRTWKIHYLLLSDNGMIKLSLLLCDYFINIKEPN